ncbi:MAG: S-layer protein, partial [Candidatus Nanohaloarchaea archaeon]
DRDTTGKDLNAGDEATVTLSDAVTGDSVEVDLDAQTGSAATDEDYTGTEVIDGQTYYLTLDGETSSGYGLKFAYGSGAGTTVNNNASDSVTTGTTSLYAPVDTDSGAAMALTEPVDVSASSTIEMPSTESTDQKTFDLSGLSLASGANTTITVGQTRYVVENKSAGTYTVGVEADQSSANAPVFADPGVLTVLPEDDSDNEEGYFVSAGYDGGDDQVTVNNAVYTGATAPNQRQTSTLESNDDVTAGVDYFGTYTEYDSDEQHTFTMQIPAGQATAGAAFTGQNGGLSASAGGAGSVTTQTPAGWPDVGALDSDSNIGQLKNNRNLILVGGPVVNSLVQELADAGKTQAASEYSDGQAIVQQIDNAFSQGNDALVVAGQSGQDTREAANFLANYESNQDRMAGTDKVTLTTAQSMQ